MMRPAHRWVLAAGVAAFPLAGLAGPAQAGGPACPPGRAAIAVPAGVRPGPHEVLVRLPPGAVVILPAAVMSAPTPAAAVTTAMPGLRPPGLRLIAEMQTMMHRMDREMAALMAPPSWAAGPAGPARLIRTVFGPHLFAAVAPGSGVMVTSVSTGQGSCSESIRYTYPLGGGAPVVKVTHTGNACGAIHLSGPGLVPTAQPVPRAPAAGLAPRPAPLGPRLTPAVYRLRAVLAPTAPHA